MQNKSGQNVLDEFEIPPRISRVRPMDCRRIPCNGNLISYKAKKACNAQLLFHYILITLHLFYNISVLTLLQHLLTNK